MTVDSSVVSSSEVGKNLNASDARIDFRTLNKYFGYSKFRPLQKEIIIDVLDGKDVLVLMPTGGGKSLCYQYPSLLSEGLTIVVSPLISLMKNQVDSLRSNGIDAEYINSSLNYSEINGIKSSLSQNKVRLLYVAPERLTTPSFITFLKELRIKLFAIDEAHCISEWGHDFRPEYRQLRLIRESFPNIPIIALTATATPKVQEDIITQLGLKQCRKYIASFNRENLIYTVRPKEDTLQQIVQFLKKRPNESGIIYCQSRKTVDSLTENLQRAGYRVLPYHAGLSQAIRSQNQEKFIKDDVEVLVATIAFGMGIDKPNIRFVIHYDMPKNLEGYYQETGRAGRDGLKSDCILFYSYGDRQKIEFFINQMADDRERQIALNKLRYMISFCESSVCRRKILMTYFGEELDKCSGCDNCLNPKDKIDASKEAGIILSCIAEVGERFGTGYVADVITGSRNQRLLMNGHESLKSFGTGKHLAKKNWQSFIRELIQLGYLELENETYPILKLNQKSHAFLLGGTGAEKEKIFLTKPEIHEKPVEIAEDVECDIGLFEALRVLRKKMADAENLPPYIIFTDASLKQMAALHPRTLFEFRKINGVGDKKLEKYGEVFLKEISKHCEKNEFAWKGQGKTLSSESATLEMLNQNLTPEEIASRRGLAPSTVYTHIENLIMAGEDIPIERFIKKEKIDVIRDAVLEIGVEKLKPIKDKLGENYSYEEIRLVRAKISVLL
jgi:ATP-dependent DNA helicase RecQ